MTDPQTMQARCIGRKSLLVFAALATLSAVATAYSVADFYKNRSISLVIGYSVGGGYDAYARLVARYIGKHIPGQPSIVPQQMTGAGSLRAANYMFSVAPKDGAVLGIFSRSMGIAPLLGQAEFDSRKFTWLGSITDDNTTCVTWNSSPIKTWDDFLSKPSKLGGLGADSDPDIWALLYKNVFGAKVQLVSGYPGTNDVVLAMERGEVDGLCGLSWSTIKTRHAEWLTSHSANIIVQAALKKEPEIAAVPLAINLVKNPEQLQIIRLLLASQAMARPFAAPPDIPADRKAALIAAFDATMRDADFLGEAQKLNFEIHPVTASTIDALLAEVYATPKDVLARAANSPRTGSSPTRSAMATSKRLSRKPRRSCAMSCGFIAAPGIPWKAAAFLPKSLIARRSFGLRRRSRMIFAPLLPTMSRSMRAGFAWPFPMSAAALGRSCVFIPRTSRWSPPRRCSAARSNGSRIAASILPMPRRNATSTGRSSLPPTA